jgi:TM2 domain-containing membrane protein YozV
MKKLLLLCALALACAAAAEPKDYSYGLHLFEEGDYYRAVTELERFRFFEPKAKEAEAALWLVASSYFKGAKWEQAGQRYAEFAQSYPKSPKARQAAFYAAESLFEARKLPEARQAFEALLPAAEPAYLLPLQLRLASLHLIVGRWSEAAEQFAQAKKAPEGRLEQLERWERLSLEGKSFQPKSQPLAFALSTIIPGAGQMYSGYVGDGFSSLLMVGGFAAWSAFFYSGKQDTPGTLFACAAGVFYLSNLHGALVSAKRANKELPRARMKLILDEMSGTASPDPDPRPWAKP